MPLVRSLESVVAQTRRVPRGETHPFARLTEPDVREIKRLLKAKATSQAKIAQMFGVSKSTITLIATGKAWTHIEDGE